MGYPVTLASMHPNNSQQGSFGFMFMIDVVVLVPQVVGMITRKDIARYRDHSSRGHVTMTLLDIL